MRDPRLRVDHETNIRKKSNHSVSLQALRDAAQGFQQYLVLYNGKTRIRVLNLSLILPWYSSPGRASMRLAGNGWVWAVSTGLRTVAHCLPECPRGHQPDRAREEANPGGDGVLQQPHAAAAQAVPTSPPPLSVRTDDAPSERLAITPPPGAADSPAIARHQG